MRSKIIIFLKKDLIEKCHKEENLAVTVAAATPSSFKRRP